MGEIVFASFAFSITYTLYILVLPSSYQQINVFYKHVSDGSYYFLAIFTEAQVL